MGKKVFNKKHYLAIAKIISELNLNDNEIFIVFLDFAKALEEDNPEKFKLFKFQTAIFSVLENLQKEGGE